MFRLLVQFSDDFCCCSHYNSIRIIDQMGRTGHQIRALFIKNLHLQKRQPCTNCCQILTPIICLVLTILIRNVAIENIPTQNNTVYGIFPLFANTFNNYTIADIFPEYITREKAQFFMFDYDRPEDKNFIGQNIGYSQFQKSGILGEIAKTYPYPTYYNNSMNRDYQYKYAPSFQKSNLPLSNQLFERYQFLNNDTLQALRHTNTAQKLPQASMHFHQASRSKLNATLMIKDVRQFLFYRPSGITSIYMKIDPNSTKFNKFYVIPQGFLTLMDMTTNAYVKHTTGKSITSGYSYMPITQEGSVFIEMIINTVATIIFPLSLSLLLPVFLYLTVLQKQQKLIQMMRMNGMSMLNYWSINFLYNLIISIFTNLVFYLFGYIFLPNAFFTQTSLLVIAIIFFGWILSQIGLSMFLQAFLSTSRAANIIGYLLAIWTNLIGATLSIVLYQYPRTLGFGFSLWPTFSFSRLFYLLFTYCSMDRCLKSVNDLTQDMWWYITVLYVSFFIFALVGMYLFEVIPQQFGVSQPVLFPIYYIVNKFKTQRNELQKPQFQAQEGSDATIDQQRLNIRKINQVSEYPLLCCGLTKQYSNGKLAVNDLYLKVEDNTIFGLLGPNGAGKTTLLSMITGIFSPTSGNAYVSGFSVINQIDSVHLHMGVCPQFDVLWPTLSVQQHLYFYSRLRGVQRKDQKQKVQQTLLEVNLVDQRNFKVHQLSGGMKRRLSIGISLVGDPRIVFMDEPTSGLDPQNRRHLWEVLSNCRAKRSLFLNTHMMQEAQSLCDQIGIITNSTIRTTGDLDKLKQIYGKGYFVTVSVQMNRTTDQNINMNFENQEKDSMIIRNASIMTEKIQDDKIRKNWQRFMRIKQKVLHVFQPAVIVKEISGMIKLNVQQTQVSVILQILHELAQEQQAFEWAISQSTLEDVFLEVVNRYDPFAKPSILQDIDSVQNYDA